jgi:hypothetical protein
MMLFSIEAERSMSVRFNGGPSGILVEAVDTMLSATLSAVLIEDAV